MIIFHNRIYQEDVNANPKVMYIIPTNDKKELMRVVGSNVIGLRCRYARSAAWSDVTLDSNILKIDEDLSEIKKILRHKQIVVLSNSLLGEEIDRMQVDCPKTYAYIKSEVDKLFKRFSGE
tara:strand:- start:513 stop:875 length:363 start_codon:yes stop_codon:yes gene_type:complete